MESRIQSVVRLVLVAVLMLFAVPATAQDGFRRFSPDKFERKTKTDDDGMIQWAEHESEKCPTCAGTGKTTCKVCERFDEDATNCPDCHRKEGREVVCRTCLGTGGFPDPLEKVQCPGCMGAGYNLCLICGGGGRLKVNKAKQWSDCPGCRGEGAYKCATCDGQRFVGVAGLKPSLAEADSKKLTKALQTTDEVLKGLAAFQPKPGPKIRKDMKELANLVKEGKSVFPALKNTEKQVGDYLGKTFAGSQFIGHEDSEVQTLELMKASVEYYLQHQKRMMELALKRAEANEKLAAEKK